MRRFRGNRVTLVVRSIDRLLLQAYVPQAAVAGPGLQLLEPATELHNPILGGVWADWQALHGIDRVLDDDPVLDLMEALLRRETLARTYRLNVCPADV